MSDHACFEGLPPATLEDARKVLELMLSRNEELSEEAALLAAAVRVERLYLNRALEGVKNAQEEEED
ncbi:MAG: hypothetical protein LBF93_06750 [Zoogloeaceae bacterium]|jgi:hypothetical protein|nr:hypothetical protein [Zoogloeaceae bacterium]